MAKLTDATGKYTVAERHKYGERPGFKITELALDSGQEVPWHRHTHVNDTFYVVAGRLRITVRDPDERVILSPTDTYTVRRGRRHQVTSDDDSPVRFLVIGDAQGSGTYDFEPVDNPG